MLDEQTTSHCEFCEQRTSCSNIFTALRILESELKTCKDPQLLKRFEGISNEIADHGYLFPKGHKLCKISGNDRLATDFILRLRRLLEAVRAQSTHP